jgi:hypothetical protein
VPHRCGRFFASSPRTGHAPFVTHPALHKTLRMQVSSSSLVDIDQRVSTRADIARVEPPARSFASRGESLELDSVSALARVRSGAYVASIARADR